MTASTAELVQVRYQKLKNIDFSVTRITHGYMHTHSGFEMGLVLSGQVTVHCGGQSQQADRGDMLLFNVYQAHMLSSQEGADVLLLRLSPGFGKEYFARIASVEFDASVLTKLKLEILEDLRDTFLTAARVFFEEAAAFGLECAGCIAHVVAVMLRHIPYSLSTDSEYMSKKKRIGRKQRIADFVESHYREKLTLTHLAKAEGITTAYMSRIFGELFGESFQEYLSKLRLQKAVPLLKKPNMYLVDVCMECGFSDTRYLNAVCQKLHNCSAAEFRKQLMEADGPGKDAPEPDGKQYSNADALRILHNYMAQ